MTLSALQALLGYNLGDDNAELATVAKANAWLNAAMRHVANWADRQNQMLFYTTATCADTGAADASGFTTVHFYTGSTPNFAISPTLARYRRLLAVESITGSYAPLPQVDFELREQYRTSSPSSTPAVCVLNTSIMLISAANSLNIKLHYIMDLPDMTDGNDTPGQSGGAGTANRLPTEYHPLIATYATVLALASEESDTSTWRELYVEQRDELMQTLTARRGARMERT